MYLKPQSYEVWFLRYGVRHIIFCHFGPCFTLLTLPPSPNNLENQNFEKLKKASRDHFTHVYQKSQSYDLCFVRYGARQTEFFLIFDHFLTFYPTYLPRKPKFWKNEKNAWRYHHFTKVHHKQQWYVWFLRYEVRQTEFFVILSYFLLFYQGIIQALAYEK